MAHNSARQRLIPHDLQGNLPTARGYFDLVGHHRSATFYDFRTTLNVPVDLANGLVHELLSEGYIVRAGAQGYRKKPPTSHRLDRTVQELPQAIPDIPYMPTSLGYRVCEVLRAFPEGLSATDVADLSGDRTRYSSVCNILRALRDEGYAWIVYEGKAVHWTWTKYPLVVTQNLLLQQARAKRTATIARLTTRQGALRRELDALYRKVAIRNGALEEVSRRLLKIQESGT